MPVSRPRSGWFLTRTLCSSWVGPGTGTAGGRRSFHSPVCYRCAGSSRDDDRQGCARGSDSRCGGTVDIVTPYCASRCPVVCLADLSSRSRTTIYLYPLFTCHYYPLIIGPLSRVFQLASRALAGLRDPRRPAPVNRPSPYRRSPLPRSAHAVSTRCP